MDLADLKHVFAGLDLDLSEMKVVDVGCGTGRLAKVCGEYVGFDVSPSMVEYARKSGVDAYVIENPDDLDELHADIVCCLSVFTHISREDRLEYLDAFSRVAPLLLVDILPGEEGGYPGIWFADPVQFEIDLLGRYQSFEAFSRTSLDSADHRYYLCRR